MWSARKSNKVVRTMLEKFIFISGIKELWVRLELLMTRAFDEGC